MSTTVVLTPEQRATIAAILSGPKGMTKSEFRRCRARNRRLAQSLRDARHWSRWCRAAGYFDGFTWRPGPDGSVIGTPPERERTE